MNFFLGGQGNRRKRHRLVYQVRDIKGESVSMELHQVPIPTTVIIGIMHTIISIEAVFLPYIFNMPQNVHEMVADIWALSIDIGTSLSEGQVSGHLMIQEVAQFHHQCAHGLHPWHLPLYLPYSHPFLPHQHAQYSHHQPLDQLILLTPVLLQGVRDNLLQACTSPLKKSLSSDPVSQNMKMTVNRALWRICSDGVRS